MLSEDAQWMLNRRSLNIDLSSQMSFRMSYRQRQFDWRDKGEKWNRDITMSEIEKLAKFYNKFHFCRIQLSDPIHHPKFAEILKHLYDRNIDAIIHNASSARPKEYYIKCFEAHPNARWVFGIDGLA